MESRTRQPQPHSATHYGEPNQARRELSFIAPSSTNYTILVHYTSTLYVCRSSQLASSSSSSSSSLKLPHIKQRTRQNLVQNTSRASLGRPSFSRSLAHQIPPSPLRAAVHYHAEETTQTALPSLFRAGDVPAAVEWRSVPHTSHKRTVSPYKHSICTVHLTHRGIQGKRVGAHVPPSLWMRTWGNSSISITRPAQK
jgi:hypothetical protein